MRLKTDSLRAFVALLISALYLGATMLGFAHLAEQQHAVCIEHGELHHVSADVSDVELTTERGAQLSSHGWAEDEHCELLHFFQNNTFTVAHASASYLLASDADELPERRPVALRLSESDRWRIAPKQSPPASV